MGGGVRNSKNQVRNSKNQTSEDFLTWGKKEAYPAERQQRPAESYLGNYRTTNLAPTLVHTRIMQFFPDPCGGVASALLKTRQSLCSGKPVSLPKGGGKPLWTPVTVVQREKKANFSGSLEGLFADPPPPEVGGLDQKIQSLWKKKQPGRPVYQWLCDKDAFAIQ